MSYRVLSKYRPELMGAAMLWVMLFHARDLDFGILSLNLIRSAGFGGVDIFIMLSAVGLVMSLSAREQEFSQFMKRRAVRILPAYYVVMLAYTLFSILRGNAPVSALVWNSTLLAYWVHAKGAFNWYVSGIMLFYALTPFCFRHLKRSRHRELCTASGMVLGLLCCRIMIGDGYWDYLDVFYRVPVFLMGLLLGFYVQEERRLSGRDILFWAVCVAAGAAYIPISLRSSVETVYFPMCHLFLFTTIPICLTGCWCFEHLPLGWLRKFLRLVGENSLEIYLLNVSFFSETALLQQYIGFRPRRWLYYLITFTLNIALGLLLHRLVEGGVTAVRVQRAAE